MIGSNALINKGYIPRIFSFLIIFNDDLIVLCRLQIFSSLIKIWCVWMMLKNRIKISDEKCFSKVWNPLIILITSDRYNSYIKLFFLIDIYITWMIHCTHESNTLYNGKSQLIEYLVITIVMFLLGMCLARINNQMIKFFVCYCADKFNHIIC